jgi:hypothetical protein
LGGAFLRPFVPMPPRAVTLGYVLKTLSRRIWATACTCGVYELGLTRAHFDTTSCQETCMSGRLGGCGDTLLQEKGEQRGRMCGVTERATVGCAPSVLCVPCSCSMCSLHSCASLQSALLTFVARALFSSEQNAATINCIEPCIASSLRSRQINRSTACPAPIPTHHPDARLHCSEQHATDPRYAAVRVLRCGCPGQCVFELTVPIAQMSQVSVSTVALYADWMSRLRRHASISGPAVWTTGPPCTGRQGLNYEEAGGIGMV